VIVKNGGTLVSNDNAFSTFMNFGSAMHVEESRVDLRNSVFTNNTAGIRSIYGRVSSQSDNINLNSVGLLSDSSSSATIKNTNLEFNELGIVAAANSAVAAKKSVIRSFHANTGVIAGSNATFIADGCTFTASRISATSGALNVSGFAGDSKASVGAIYGSDSFVRVTNSTIVGHSTLNGSRGDISSTSLSGNSFVFKPGGGTSGFLTINSQGKSSDFAFTKIVPSRTNTSNIGNTEA